MNRCNGAKLHVASQVPRQSGTSRNPQQRHPQPHAIRRIQKARRATGYVFTSACRESSKNIMFSSRVHVSCWFLSPLMREWDYANQHWFSAPWCGPLSLNWIAGKQHCSFSVYVQNFSDQIHFIPCSRRSLEAESPPLPFTVAPSSVMRMKFWSAKSMSMMSLNLALFFCAMNTSTECHTESAPC